jgi:hypothetical protein
MNVGSSMVRLERVDVASDAFYSLFFFLVKPILTGANCINCTVFDE